MSDVILNPMLFIRHIRKQTDGVRKKGFACLTDGEAFSPNDFIYPVICG